jgi:hypothetical protein
MNYYIYLRESNGISSDVLKLSKIIIDKVSLIENGTYSFNYIGKDIKVNNLIIDIKYNDTDNDLCYGNINLTDSIISDDILNNVSIKIEIDTDNFTYIESIIIHEITHLLQNYKLKIDNKFRPHYWSIGSVYRQLRENIKSKYVSYILYLVYSSLEHELYALLHQSYYSKDFTKINKVIHEMDNFHIKSLDLLEFNELNSVKRIFIKSMEYFTTNKKYLSDINKSMWQIEDNSEFLNEIDKYFKRMSKKLKKKLSMIKESNEIDYSITISGPDPEDYPTWFTDTKFMKILTS